MSAKFEWDDAKAASNLAKHGISFDEAMEVFAVPALAVLSTTREADGEARYKAIGILSGRLITVVFTKRNAVRRIISARRSNRKEEKSYGDRAADA